MATWKIFAVLAACFVGGALLGGSISEALHGTETLKARAVQILHGMMIAFTCTALGGLIILWRAQAEERAEESRGRAVEWRREDEQDRRHGRTPRNWLAGRPVG